MKRPLGRWPDLDRIAQIPAMSLPITEPSPAFEDADPPKRRSPKIHTDSVARKW